MKMFSFFRKSIFFLSLFLVGFANGQKKNVLIFSYAAGFVHSSIPQGKDLFKNLAEKNGFSYTLSEDPTVFNDDFLSKIDIIVFNQTTGDILDKNQEAAFEKFIQNGGDYLGIHAAADCEYEYPFYLQTMGAYFRSHPPFQTAAKINIEGNHPVTQGITIPEKQKDEWYNYRAPIDETKFKVLMSLDEKTYFGGRMGKRHPIAWISENGKSKTFYTGIGHREEILATDWYIKLIDNALNWLAQD